MVAIRRCAVIVLACFATGASADERELAWRLGIARSSVDAEVPTHIFGSQDVGFDDFGPRIAIEGSINERFGFELGAMDLGSTKVDVFRSDHASVVWAALTPHVKAGPWTLAAKVGAATANTDVRFSEPVPRLGEKAITTELFVGTSATYHFTNRVGVHLSIEQIGDVATVVGLDYRHGWRALDAESTSALGFELLIGPASATPGIGTIRYPFDADYDVVVRGMTQPTSTYSIGLRVPFASWLSFEVAYFPKSAASNYTTGGLDPQPPQPPMGPPVIFGVSLDSTVEFEGSLLAARFEYEPSSDADLFATVGALAQRETVQFRNSNTGTLVYSESEASVHPWLGVGVRYRFYKALALTVEVARADGENRSRAMIGLTF